MCANYVKIILGPCIRCPWIILSQKSGTDLVTSLSQNQKEERSYYILTVLLVLSRLRTNLGLSRILNHQICIVIRAFELQVMLQLEMIHLNR
jgi:hypothetical protein